MSVGKTYSQAKTEWNFTGDVVDHGFIKDQKPVAKCNFCGHPIRYGYILKNSKNSKKVEVGSECVENFMNITVTVANKMEIAKKNAVKKAKQEAREKVERAYAGAYKEVKKLELAVYEMEHLRNRINDSYFFHAIYNNKVIFYDKIKSGKVVELAKKYDVKLDMDKINAFMEVYKPEF